MTIQQQGLSPANQDALSAAYEEAYALPLEAIDVSVPDRFAAGTHWPFFERLRKEAPVHYCADSAFGPYWSVVTYKEIIEVETKPFPFSSDPQVIIGDMEEDFQTPMFICMDPPKHDEQRKAVAPAVSPKNLQKLEPIIRERVGKLLDDLPENEDFNWVDKVSIELTAQMLATLFNMPMEDCYKLPIWSDAATSAGTTGDYVYTEEEKRAHLLECFEYFAALWDERLAATARGEEPGDDFVSLMAHSDAMSHLRHNPMEFIGTLMLLIVGGNDTTRNSLSGGAYALNLFPDEFRKLRADPGLIPNMVQEIIRWQTPLSHMRRTLKADATLAGQTLREGEKVVMWYISANRDATMIEEADLFRVDRAQARNHLSFGFGIHRCMGARMGEMQLRIAWEEILKRFKSVELAGEPTRVSSSFVHGYSDVPMRVKRF
ncbi:MAG: cytochrome P450 [Pseudomonadota bacterium]